MKKRFGRFVTAVAALSVLYAGPVAACVCPDDHPAAMPCCPDERRHGDERPHEDPQHGHQHSGRPIDDRLPSAYVACDPRSADSLPAGSPERPAPGAPPVACELWSMYDRLALVSPLTVDYHGPPIYLATRRLRN